MTNRQNAGNCTHYLVYYHQARTHLALDKDAPDLGSIAIPAIGNDRDIPHLVGSVETTQGMIGRITVRSPTC
jgi:hypothetical protein